MILTPHPKIILTSFGLKSSGNASGSGYILPKAHFYLDCRGVPDSKGAKDVLAWLDDRYTPEGVNIRVPTFPHYRLAMDAIEMIPSRRKEREGPYAEPFVICCLCAHGQNRSVAMKRILEKALPSGWVVEVT